MFSGPISAIVTPFKRGKIDFRAFENLIEFQIKGGVTGLVVCGTTGEAATLSDDEQIETIGFAVRAARGRVPVIAGAGSNETRHAVELSVRAQQAGADAVLSVTPYYNKPPQHLLIDHFRRVAAAVTIPVILYNVPTRTGLNLLPSSVVELAKVKNIVAVKEASGSLAQSVEILQRTGDKFTVLSGEDPLYLPLLSIGAKGIISVTANVAPREMAALYAAFCKGEVEKARRLHDRLWPLTQALFVETNPIPVKAALAMMGMIAEEYRPPMGRMTPASRRVLRKAMADFGLLKGK